MIERLIAFSGRNAFLVVLMIFGIVGAGAWAIKDTPIDAIPDLSDVQVIIMSEWEGRSPTIIEDQVTYPIVTALLSAPRVCHHRVAGPEHRARGSPTIAGAQEPRLSTAKE